MNTLNVVPEHRILKQLNNALETTQSTATNGVGTHICEWCVDKNKECGI